MGGTKQPKKDLNDLSKPELIALVKELKKRKKFGLVWEDKPEQVVEDCKNNLPVLEEVADKAINKLGNAPTNIIIEGDNYHALSALNYTHAGKIDVIYIDPPYNTGNKDFIYNDKFVDKEDSYRHSKWLSFMEKRLVLAKNLLSESGVIFISIDDNEQANLKLLCDEVFGENNFLSRLIWESTTQPTNTGSAKFQIQKKTEIIYCFANNKNIKSEFILKDLEKLSKYPHQGKLGNCRFEIIEKSDSGSYSRKTMKFEILGQFPRNGKRWQIGIETATDLISKNRIEIVDGIVKKAVYPEDETDKQSLKPFWSLFLASEAGTAQTAKEELNKAIGFHAGFDTVKPINLIKELMGHFKDNSTILDFFAGSGTTGHALMQLNKEDGGNRQFILCTNNENKIAEEVTYPRIRNVINGYGKVEGISANVKYFKTSFVSSTKSDDQTTTDLLAKCLDMLRIKENAFEEVVSKPEYALLKGYKGYLAVCLDTDYLPELKQAIADTNQAEPSELPFIFYIFSYSDIDFNSELADMGVEFSILPIPGSILEVYKRIFNNQRSLGK